MEDHVRPNQQRRATLSNRRNRKVVVDEQRNEQIGWLDAEQRVGAPKPPREGFECLDGLCDGELRPCG